MSWLSAYTDTPEGRAAKALGLLVPRTAREANHQRRMIEQYLIEQEERAVGQETWSQPGMCQCQEDDSVLHIHYTKGNHACARCSCKGWRPSIRPVIRAIQEIKRLEQEKRLLDEKVGVAWMVLARSIFWTSPRGRVGVPRDLRHEVMKKAENKIVRHMINEASIVK